MTDASTIFALSSGPGKAGVAVIRVSGPKARSALETMAAPDVAPYRAAYRRIVHPQTRDLLDLAVVINFPAPRSETGEDVVEFQIHGGRATIEAVLEALATVPGCRLAEPGEFARRAFHNGKLNLAEVEQLGDLIDAETEAQRLLALRLAPKLYEEWRARLIEIAGLTEAAIDFTDEADVSEKSLEAARERADALRTAILAHLDDGHRGELIRQGFRVALLGPPNAGKSSLLNALAKRDVAIVSEEAGTTRDVIEVRLDLGGYTVILSDTAGIRETEGTIETEGIRRSLETADAANLVVWLSETGLDSLPEAISRETILDVRTKSDLDAGPERPEPLADPQTLAISAKTGAGLEALIRRISEAAASAMAVGADPVVTRARHRRLLEDAAQALSDFLEGDRAAIELRAEDIRRAAHALGRITGHLDVEDILGDIFSRFCIGK